MSIDKQSAYYDVGGIEAMDVISAKLTSAQLSGFLLGNVLKYSMRMMHKTPGNPKRDAQKALMYSDLLYQYLKDEGHRDEPVDHVACDSGREHIANIRHSIDRLRRVIDNDVDDILHAKRMVSATIDWINNVDAIVQQAERNYNRKR